MGSFLKRQDLATQLYYWDAYRKSCRLDGRPLGKYLSVPAAEFLSGTLSLHRLKLSQISKWQVTKHVATLYHDMTECSEGCHVAGPLHSLVKLTLQTLHVVSQTMSITRQECNRLYRTYFVLNPAMALLWVMSVSCAVFCSRPASASTCCPSSVVWVALNWACPRHTLKFPPQLGWG